MNLPFFSKKNSNNQSYFGLYLKSKGGVGIVIKKEGNKLIAFETVKFDYSNGWENLTQDIDEVLLKLETKTKLKLKETIVFVFSHLIDLKTGQIKDAYAGKLKELFKNLELKPLGYIECFEAVASYLEERDQIPPTLILIEIDSSDLSVFVYKGGKMVFKKTSAATSDIVDDLKNCFDGMHGTLLPSRMILYNSHDLDNQSTQIMTHRWEESYFVQPPRAEVVTEPEVVVGLISVFQEQLATDKTEKIEDGRWKMEDRTQSTLVPRSSESEVGKHETQNNMQEAQTIEGFVVGGDVEKNLPKTERSVINKQRAENQFIFPPIIHELKMKIQQLTTRVKKLKLSLSVYIVIGVVIIALGLFLNEYFFHKASLVIYVESQDIKKNLEVSSSDIDIFPSTSSAQFSQTRLATGKRDVGEKAVGKVTVHNFDDTGKNFTKGTVVSADNFNFILQEDLKVASASETTIGGNLVRQPGKATVGAMASEIGPQYNIGVGKRFKIDDLSTTLYFAINENAFSGGSKKQITTVSKANTDLLITKIKDQAAKENKNIKEQKIEQKVLDELTSTDLKSLKYSKEVGEEASNVTLTATAVTTKYLYNNKDMIDYILSNLNNDLQSGLVLNSRKVNYTIEKAALKAGEINLRVRANAKALQDVSEDKILTTVLGRDARQVQDSLKKDFKVVALEFKNKEPIFIFSHLFPFFKKNIDLIITSY